MDSRLVLWQNFSAYHDYIQLNRPRLHAVRNRRHLFRNEIRGESALHCTKSELTLEVIPSPRADGCV
jgi:hypothetical protein